MSRNCLLFFCLLLGIFRFSAAQSVHRKLFNSDWYFYLAKDTGMIHDVSKKYQQWRRLHLPHDWSIELPFDKNSAAGTGGGALNGGTGWYYKRFLVDSIEKGKSVVVDFDGIYRNSTVYVNGQLAGYRPNGYISFRYDISKYIRYGAENEILVKADNSEQPNSRWYSGSGIYRNVWLSIMPEAYIGYNGTFITTPVVGEEKAVVELLVKIEKKIKGVPVKVKSFILDADGKLLAEQQLTYADKEGKELKQEFILTKPQLWSLENPYRYKMVTVVSNQKNEIVDEYITPFGIRYFRFDTDNGFFLNDEKVKIRGVCMHHDLGALGTAINSSAMRRQLNMLKEMGVNGIRTTHNPPATEWLQLCDEMGFIVMDETFDMWKKKKSEYDYHLNWDEWWEKDLTDHVVRDRNHPSVFMWSVGNEIQEQWGADEDTVGASILRQLHQTVKNLDKTRPVLTANNEINPWNKLLSAGADDIIGYNYNHKAWDSAHLKWGGKPFIVTESTSALQTRGSYDMPSDSIRLWPEAWDIPLKDGNKDTTCSAYDNCATPWGSSHEISLQLLEKYPHISGMYVWTGFDYIGEPTPYPWPARSSYFGIIDLAGFPKDVYYLYQSVWTDKPVLHIFPHWNWEPGQQIDVWAYYSQADEVELFLNGISMGTRKKTEDELKVVWKLTYQPGKLEAVSRKGGKEVLRKVIYTAGSPAGLVLEADRKALHAGQQDLSFLTVKVVDGNGNIVPQADNLIQFSIIGDGRVKAVDNGSQTSGESFRGNKRKAMNGLALAVIEAGPSKGKIIVKAFSKGLAEANIEINVE